MPTVLTWNEACHWTVAPGLRLAARENGSPAGTRLAPVPWLTYPSISSRVWNRIGRGQQLDVQPGLGLAGAVGDRSRHGDRAAGLGRLRGHRVDDDRHPAGLSRLPRLSGWACAGAARARTAATAAGTRRRRPGTGSAAGCPPVASRAHLEWYCRSKPNPCVTLNGRAHDQRTAEGGRRAAARACARGRRHRPPVRPARLPAGPGRRSGPGRVPRRAAQRPRPDHRRHPGAGPGRGRGLGRRDVDGGHRLRHRGPAQGQHDLRDHHLPQRAVPGRPRASPTCGTAGRSRRT